MIEIIFVLAATIVVFALFLLAFFIKSRTESDEARIPTCAHCDCQRRQVPPEHAPAHFIQAGTDPPAFKGAGNPRCPAKGCH